MSPKLIDTMSNWHIHKLELLTMPVLKSGEINHIIINLIFGHLVA
jgi:hypothetical protein